MVPLEVISDDFGYGGIFAELHIQRNVKLGGVTYTAKSQLGGVTYTPELRLGDVTSTAEFQLGSAHWYRYTKALQLSGVINTMEL